MAGIVANLQRCHNGAYLRQANGVARPKQRPLFLSAKLSTNSNTTPAFYIGPLAQTFRSLKIFSLGSFALATSISPFMFVIESPLPTSARAAMAITALVTSGASTALVGWCGAPYVSSMRRIPGYNNAPDGGVEMITKTLLLRDLRTTVYDTSFLGKATRPFATWELVPQVRVQAEEGRTDGLEEVVARTTDENGQVQGEWRVRWTKAIDDPNYLLGKVNPHGKLVRHFNVHEELLNTDA